MTEVAILGGGCFWCTESVFLAVRGVLEVAPGYSGGHVANPSYEQVCGKATGHIEVVRVVFDPEVIDFETVLQVFFATHDPTTVDQQGADVGPQYASAIFCQSEQQKEIAQRVIAEVQAEIGEPVVTKVLGAEHFWPAEDYHRNYYAQHPNQGYCQAVIAPKLSKFRKRFAQLLAG
ncbi:peptide-methionine (S)-S-oxide reductase MsrA [Pollutimonas bauzanensis]|uniref:Peptide methionine sulfoxide reductase MsrA n=1 Tax=Pollutimonas bauzanensis TaxID=658167 RepID=A0A1M5ZI17_9BURK|nr:peptide-methionine (S)-S-oxide reductase MsrA [Pollutimonas bauzanensis]SHI23739.1 peptide-methionine (S)-S-oxide reductase [Pollutimonas bauzanensis]